MSRKSWWWIARKIGSEQAIDAAEFPYCDSARWRWTMLYWNDGSRSVFCNVWAPWRWLARFIAFRMLNHEAYTSKETVS
jgi:hypothetical protein